MHHLDLSGHGWMSPTHPQRTWTFQLVYPGGLAGPKFLRVHACGNLQQPHDGEVWYEYQPRGISQMSLQLTPTESLDHPDSPQQLKGA